MNEKYQFDDFKYSPYLLDCYRSGNTNYIQVTVLSQSVEQEGPFRRFDFVTSQNRRFTSNDLNIIRNTGDPTDL